MRKRDESVISFVSTVKGLDQIEECRPQPTKNFIPSWWKNVPVVDPNTEAATIRSCPSFPDYFSQGYIVPMWADTVIKYDKSTNMWNVSMGPIGEDFIWDVHSLDQALDHTQMNFFGNVATFIFKAISPWTIFTPKGWSVYQQPLFYHFDNDFLVMPGVIDTDIHHYINQQVVYFGDGEEIFIKRGQPFAQYIPFKRTKTSFEARYRTEQEEERLAMNNIIYTSKLQRPLRGVYRKLQKDRDKLI
jgi:hypothetical protein